MRYLRPLLLACALAALVPCTGLARPAAGHLVVRRDGRDGPPPNLVPELRQLAERWKQIEKLRAVVGEPTGAASGRPGRAARPLGARGLRAPAEAPPETIRVLGLRVDFLHDSVDTKSTGDGRFELQADSTAVVDPPPHDRAYFMAHLQALANFYQAQSYGSLVLTYDVYPKDDTTAYHLRDVADYGPFKFSQDIVGQIHRFVKDTFRVADQGADAIPWKKFDRVILFHAGGDFQNDIHQDSPYDIPSLTLFMYGDTSEIRTYDRAARDTVIFRATSIIPESGSQDGMISALNGVVAHEFGHLLNSEGDGAIQPDLYNTTTGMPTVGTWSLHDSGNFLGTRVGTPDGEIYAVGLVPGSFDIWSRGLMFPTAVRETDVLGADTTLTLKAIENDPGYAYVPLDQDEYLLLENREQEPDAAPADTIFLKSDKLTGVVLGPARRRIVGSDTSVVLTKEYDVLQPASGILCWHIDNSVLDLRGVNVPADSGLNTDPNRPSIGLIQGDGSKSIGDASSAYFQGGPFDPFAQGNMGDALPEDGRPNSHTNSGAYSGVSFEVLSAPGAEMQVRIRRSHALAGWPLPVTFGDHSPPGAATAADLDGDGVQEYYTVMDGGRIRGLTRYAHELRNSEGGFPFSSPGFTLEPELLTVPGWGPGGRDALVGEWHDSTQAGAPVHLVAFGADGLILDGFPAAAASLTTPPVILAGQVLAGGADGRVWKFTKDGTGTALGDSGAPVIGRLAVGPFGSGGAMSALAAYGNYGGLSLYSYRYRMFPLASEKGARPASAPGGTARIAGTQTPPQPPPMPPMPAGGRLHRPVLLGAYADTTATAATLLVVDSTGWVGAFHPADFATDPQLIVPYQMPQGFPFQLPSPPAGIATLGDISGDGRPCILVQCRDGLFYAIGMDGRPLPGFPARLPGGRAPLPGAAALECRDAQGAPMILVPTTSGDLVALNSRGKVMSGFPRAVASTWGSGCFFVPGDRGNTWLFSVGGDGAWSLDSLPGVPRANWVSLGPGVDEARSGFLARNRVATAKPATAYADLANFRAYPNPVRVAQQAELRVTFELAQPRSVRVRLYNLAGRVVSEQRWAGHVAGNVVAIPAAQLGSGLYHVEVVVEGTDSRRVTPVAIVQ